MTVGLVLFAGSWSSWGAGGFSAEDCSFPVLDSGTFTPTRGDARRGRQPPRREQLERPERTPPTGR